VEILRRGLIFVVAVLVSEQNFGTLMAEAKSIVEKQREKVKQRVELILSGIRSRQFRVYQSLKAALLEVERTINGQQGDFWERCDILVDQHRVVVGLQNRIRQMRSRMRHFENRTENHSM
jgi:hypothetical protein